VPAYTITEMDAELRQSEIITNLVQFTYEPVSTDAFENRHLYAIVLTQDCDLLWDYRSRQNGTRRDLNGVLLYELEPTPDIRVKLAGGDILKGIRRHADPRYHLLEAVPPDLDCLAHGLPELIIDFKRCYTMPADEIYRQCGLQDGAKRRCRLDTLYREHLQTRAAFYLQRVALPEDRDNQVAAVPALSAPAGAAEPAPAAAANPAAAPVAVAGPAGDGN